MPTVRAIWKRQNAKWKSVAWPKVIKPAPTVWNTTNVRFSKLFSIIRAISMQSTSYPWNFYVPKAPSHLWRQLEIGRKPTASFDSWHEWEILFCWAGPRYLHSQSWRQAEPAVRVSDLEQKAFDKRSISGYPFQSARAFKGRHGWIYSKPFDVSQIPGRFWLPGLLPKRFSDKGIPASSWERADRVSKNCILYHQYILGVTV